MELKTAIDNVKQAEVLLSDANNIMSANVSRLIFGDIARRIRALREVR